ncbi:hypothetical protein J2S49_001395 [Arcanobacterium wilhelmae]|uniref:Uncharacterized protein n=1 Tax=Arcanobacterium wilhelmae TaxID=1803177 RepID=A0ABT9NC85_9ACTO|nr:hypothetical protein [Arcanobacterium wilhelmae]MDP9801319.1 hypothetical protein [Arcanobacterium wilhelmae]WFN90659.1 hypothetical protein P8A24_02030 [Arcanobacterium wilhelmae]
MAPTLTLYGGLAHTRGGMGYLDVTHGKADLSVDTSEGELQIGLRGRVIGDAVESGVSHIRTSNGVDGILHLTPEGGQVVAVFDSKGDGNRFTLDMKVPDGTRWVSNKDGSMSLVDRGTGQTIAGIDKPWAYDADNRPLPTHFVVKNGAITQLVDMTNAKFPVVADPSWWAWAGCAAEIAHFFFVFFKAAGVGLRIYNVIKDSPRALRAWKKVGGIKNYVLGFKEWMNAPRPDGKGLTWRASAVKAFNQTIGKSMKKEILNLLGIGSCFALAFGV